jgi:hypothetical protein
MDERSMGYFGRIPHGYDRDSRPAICINNYGLGKAIYYAFDLGCTLDSKMYKGIALVLKNAIAYCYRTPKAEAFQPY